jgi:two-component system, NarL family, response regulator YdfI
VYSANIHAASSPPGPGGDAFRQPPARGENLRDDSQAAEATAGRGVTRILIAATNQIVRAGLEALVREQPSLRLTGSVVGTATLARQVEDLQPDVLLLEADVHDDETVLAGLGLDATHLPAIVLLTDVPHSARLTNEILRAGVRAMLPRETTAAEIVAAIEAAAAGLFVLHQETVDAVLRDEPQERAHVATLLQPLSPREVEVLGMLAEGLGNKTIAWRLGISEHTVKFHVGSIFNKLNATSRTEAVTLGIRQGLIMI